MSRSATGPLTRRDWSAGMVQDTPRYMIPDNAVWDALEVIVDMDGNISKRGGTKNVMTSASVLVGQQIGILQSYGIDGILMGFLFEQPTHPISGPNAGGGSVYAFPPGSGTSAFTAMASVTGDYANTGIPAAYGNMLCFPTAFSDPSNPANSSTATFVGGGTTTTFGTFGTLTFTSGSATVTGWVGGDSAVPVAGGYVRVAAVGGNGMFRVTSVNSGAHTFTVEPIPITTLTTAAGVAGTNSGMQSLTSIFTPVYPVLVGGACAVNHQTRLIFGDVCQTEGLNSKIRHASRIVWSILPTEVPSRLTNFQGFPHMISEGYEAYNYVEIPHLQQIVGLVSVNDNRLLVLGAQGISTLDGSLPTNTALNTVLTGYQVSTVSQTVGCLSQRSIQRTPKGVVFASRDGIYLYDGAALHNIMLDRIQQYWATLINAGSFAIYGSAVINPTTYLISGTSGGTAFTLICNLTGYRWSRSTGIPIMASAQDPSDPTRVYACDATATTASTSNKVFRVDPVVFPTSASTTDHTGTAPSWSIKTKTDTGVAFSGRGRRLRVLEDPSILKKYKHVTAVLNVVGSGSATVTATPGLQGEETSQLVETFTANANPQTQRVMLTTPIISKALGFTIAGSTAASSVDLISLQTDPSALSAKRVT